MNNISDLWSNLHSKSRNIETNIDPLIRKRTGSYYTDLSLTDDMMRDLIDQLLKSEKPIIDYRFFEPCVGAGNFVFSYLKKINETIDLTAEEAKTLLNNIYVADINIEAIEGYKTSLTEIASCFWGISLDNDYFSSHVGSGLLVDVSAEQLNYISLGDVFPDSISSNKFDIVVTNPPYKNLKAERDQYNDESSYLEDQSKYAQIAQFVKKTFLYSSDGVLNLYKLFVEEIIDKYANETAYISLLIPASIASDKTCEKLRTHILKDNNLLSIKMIKEGSGLIDAQQALCSILIKKGEKTSSVKVVKDYVNNPDDYACVKIGDILNKNTGNAIISVSNSEYATLKKLRSFPVVKDLKFITNLRGELDLTANKDFITSGITNHPLIRGRNIGYYELLDVDNTEYVQDDFICHTKKSIYLRKERIICQQIANMHKERRVTFSLVPANNVLANSCNFICVDENKYGVDLYGILGLFNSSIINWLFKLTSSNNHINNYEIDCFPVPVESPYMKLISEKTQEYIKTHKQGLIEQIEDLVQKAYGLTSEGESQMKSHEIISAYYDAISSVLTNINSSDAADVLSGKTNIQDYMNDADSFNKKVANGLTDKFQALYNGYILNHTTFKLSKLDLEMIKSVPQGGSWKDIPQKTVEKSKRLKRITETGGRTTLYGRIDYDKPSYTITTYFNRPGNGTYVHPIHDRVISVREAARFQTFRDDYFFYGNKTQQLKQVGNAVPVLLAYQIGRRIIEKTGCQKSIDLFCGAGGMTVGFKAAGITSLLSNDIEESACITLKINNPEIDVLCGDITLEDTKNRIEQVAKAGGADIICGGPPCQGFSMAGFRSETDPRNQLFREFVDIVKRVNPKVIVFENVEGLLSYQGGQTYREVHALFSELGYKTAGRLLLATEYAVPQKRKRVIIICTRNDLNIDPEDMYPETITREEKHQVTARETIGDLEKVECCETAKYSGKYNSDLIQFFRGQESFSDYIKGRTYYPTNDSFLIENNGQLAFNV